MLKIDKLFWRKKLVRWFLIPLFLLIFWFVSTFIYILYYDHSFLVLSYNHSLANFTSPIHNILIKGKKITGQFKAIENNLGIVSIRLNVMNRVPYKKEDVLIFRLKEKGQKDWYYQGRYRSGIIYDVPFFPFGFPKINNSKGKTYEFELESLNGNQQNAVFLNNLDPVLATKYQESKYDIFANRSLLFHFIKKKIIYCFQIPEIIFSAFTFFLPFLLYLSYLIETELENRDKQIPLFAKKKISYEIFIFIFLYLVMFDIIVIHLGYSLVYIVMMIMWLSIMHFYFNNTKATLITGITLILLCPIALALNQSKSAEIAGAWAFLFIVILVIQILIANRETFFYEKS